MTMGLVHVPDSRKVNNLDSLFLLFEHDGWTDEDISKVLTVLSTDQNSMWHHSRQAIQGSV